MVKLKKITAPPPKCIEKQHKQWKWTLRAYDNSFLAIKMRRDISADLEFFDTHVLRGKNWS